MRKAEKDMGVPFCEFAAMEFGVEKFEDIISGRETEIYTDHISLSELKLKLIFGIEITIGFGTQTVKNSQITALPF